MPAQARAAAAVPSAQGASQNLGYVVVAVTVNGAPLATGELRAYRLDEVDSRRRWSSAASAPVVDGSARLQVGRGEFLVVAHANGYAPSRVVLERQTADELTSLALEMKAGVELVGRVIAGRTHDPVPGAVVSLELLDPTMPRRAAAPAEERISASSDAKGVVILTGLTKGKFAARVEAPGYRRMGSEVAVPPEKEWTIELESTAFINGHVLDDRGNAVADAEVFASPARRFAFNEVQSTRTGTKGEFVLEAPAGAYHLWARQGSLTGRAPGPVAVTAGMTRNDVIVRLGPGAAVEGTVVESSTKSPIAGAEVTVHESWFAEDVGKAETDAQGRFEISGIPAGIYLVSAHRDGFSGGSRDDIGLIAGGRFKVSIALSRPESGSIEGLVLGAEGQPLGGVLVSAGERRTRTGADGHYRLDSLDSGFRPVTAVIPTVEAPLEDMVQVRPGQVARLDLQVKLSGRVAGHVLTRSHRPPVRSCSVEAEPSDDGDSVKRYLWKGTPEFAPKIRSDGGYEMDLPVGEHRIRVHCAEDRESGGEAVVHVVAGETTTHDFVIDDDPPVLLEGDVLEPDGTPSIGAKIAVTDERGWSPGSSETKSNSDGHFTLRDSGWPANRVLVVRASNESRTATLKPVRAGSRSLAIRLQAGASLRGRVIGTMPVEHFSLRVEATGTSARVEFSDSEFELYDLPPGPAVLSVDAGAAGSGTKAVNLIPGREAETEIRLGSAGRVVGRMVSRAPEEPWHFWRASATDANDNKIGEGRCDGDGRFEINGLPVGDYTVHLFGSSWMTERRVAILGGQTIDLGDVNVDGFRAPPGKIGVGLEDRADGVYVGSLAKDGPAERAGVLEGDRIVAADGVPVSSSKEVMERVPGKPGTPVVIAISRGGQEQSLTIIRAE